MVGHYFFRHAKLVFIIEMLMPLNDFTYVLIRYPGKMSQNCRQKRLAGTFRFQIKIIHKLARAVAMFIKGLAKNIHNFAGGGEKIYLSGGLCENRLFVNSFPCEVTLLGRYVQIEGLKSYLAADRLDLAVSG